MTRAAAMNEMSLAICRLFGEVLGVDGVGPDDDFFLMGGHSLRAMVLSWRIRRELRVEVRLEDVLAHPSPARLAAVLRSRPGVEDGSDGGSEAGTGESVALTVGQRGLWFLQEMAPGSAAYNVPLLVRMRGPLDEGAFAGAVRLIGRRHDILRAEIRTEDDEPRLVPAPAGAPSMDISVVDMSDVPEGERSGALAGFARERAAVPFDLERAPLGRAFLVRFGAEDHAALFVFHHLVCDDWSLDLMLRELGEAYAGRLEEAGAPSGLGFMRRAAAAEGGDHGVDAAWWRAAWLPPPPFVQLPTDRPGGEEPSGVGGRVAFEVPAGLHGAVVELGREERLTPFATYVAAFYVLLRRMTGERDLVIGTPMAQREHPDAEGVFGYLVNTLPLRLDAGEDDTFREVMRRAQRVAIEAFAHSSLPFQSLVEMLHPERSTGRMPLVTAMFQLDSTGAGELDLPGVRSEIVPVDTGEAKFDLYCSLIETGHGADGFIEYAKDLFDHETVERMAACFLTLLRSIVREPEAPVDRLPILDDEGLAGIVEGFSGARAEYPRGRAVHSLFADVAASSPDAVAVVEGGKGVTYRELDDDANRLAHHLIGLGVGRGDRVAVGVGRSTDFIVTVLAVLKAGGVYVPLDMAYPPARLKFMLRDTAARVLVTRGDPPGGLAAPAVVRLDRLAEQLGGRPAADPGVEVGPEDGAYVIYTSGSTGEPKGVLVPHRAIARLVLGQEYAAFGPGAVHLMLAPTTFDASTFELWGALLHGARIVVYGEELVEPGRLGEAIRDGGVTRVWLTAALYNAMIDMAPEVLAPLSELLIGGEALSVSHVRRGLGVLPQTRITNGYGPTESTTFACTYAIPRALDPEAKSVPIGRPLRNTQVYILDRHLRPVPRGVVGELCIGGDGLAIGYLNNPELTARKFVQVSIPGRGPERVYRTGDLARFLSDGRIEYRGRMDNQVKIRGFRIEPDEVTAVLLGMESVRQAAVVARRDQRGEVQLVAYVAGHGDRRPVVSEVQPWLRDRLPSYMLPAFIVPVDELPISRNGKLDRAALPEPTAGAGAAAGVQAALPVSAPTETEVRLLEIWRRVLGRQDVERDDNYFDLGGHSLLAVKLFSAIERELGRRMSISTLFRLPTVRQLAGAIERDLVVADSCLLALRPVGVGHPIFVLGGIGGQLFAMKPLVDLLAPDRPCFGLEPPGLAEGERPLGKLEEIAAALVERVRRVQPEGPLTLVGYSFGGVVAFEMARQLRGAGREVPELLLIDSYLDTAFQPKPAMERAVIHLRRWVRNPRAQFAAQYAGVLRRLHRVAGARRRSGDPEELLRNKEGFERAAERVGAACMLAYRAYLPAGPCDVRGHVFVRSELPEWQEYMTGPGERLWTRYMARGVSFHMVPGNHRSLIEGANSRVLVNLMNECLRSLAAGAA